MVLARAKVGHKSHIKRVCGTEKIKKFLLSLGCYEGEEITLVSMLAGNYVINIKDSRYAIDKKMANYIELVS